jgi:hypothetical protein
MRAALTKELQPFLAKEANFERHVIANDNSCLFHSINFSCARIHRAALPIARETAALELGELGGADKSINTGADKTGAGLREVCASKVLADPTSYPPEVLGKVNTDELNHGCSLHPRYLFAW